MKTMDRWSAVIVKEEVIANSFTTLVYCDIKSVVKFGLEKETYSSSHFRV